MNDEDIRLMRAQAHHRRKVLILTGCSTYRIRRDHRGEAVDIICLCCGIATFEPEHLGNRYCPFCICYHSDWIADITQEPSA